MTFFLQAYYPLTAFKAYKESPSENGGDIMITLRKCQC